MGNDAPFLCKYCGGVAVESGINDRGCCPEPNKDPPPGEGRLESPDGRDGRDEKLLAPGARMPPVERGADLAVPDLGTAIGAARNCIALERTALVDCEARRVGAAARLRLDDPPELRLDEPPELRLDEPPELAAGARREPLCAFEVSPIANSNRATRQKTLAFVED